LLDRFQLLIYSTFIRSDLNQTFKSHLDDISMNINSLVSHIAKQQIPKGGTSLLLPVTLNNSIVEFNLDIPKDVSIPNTFIQVLSQL
jgi:hypothetical protein